METTTDISYHFKLNVMNKKENKKIKKGSPVVFNDYSSNFPGLLQIGICPEKTLDFVNSHATCLFAIC